MTIVDKNYSIAAMINESKQLLNANKCSTYMYMMLQYKMTAYSKMKASQIISVFSQGKYSRYDIFRDIQLFRIRKESKDIFGREVKLEISQSKLEFDPIWY